MSTKNLSMRLIPKEDDYGNKYYMAQLKFPGTIQLENGATFFVFISEEGFEELQIAPMTNKNSLDKDKK